MNTSKRNREVQGLRGAASERGDRRERGRPIEDQRAWRARVRQNFLLILLGPEVRKGTGPRVTEDGWVRLRGVQ